MDSLLNQTIENIEIICIVDNDLNEIFNLIKSYSLVNENIKIEKNIRFIKPLGNYVFILNSKDWLSLIGLEEMLNVAIKEDSDILLSSLNIFDEFNQNIYEIELLTPDSPDKSFLINNPFKISKYCNNLYKSSFLEKNNIKLPKNNFENPFFFIKTIFAAGNVEYYKYPVIYKRINNECYLDYLISNDFINKNNYDLNFHLNYFSLLDNIDNLIIFFKEKGIYDLHKYNLLNYCISLLKNSYKWGINDSDFHAMKDFIKRYANVCNSDFVLTLKTSNLDFYRKILNAETLSEFQLMFECSRLSLEKEKFIVNLEKAQNENRTLKNINNNQLNQIKNNKEEMDIKFKELNQQNVDLSNKLKNVTSEKDKQIYQLNQQNADLNSSLETLTLEKDYLKNKCLELIIKQDKLLYVNKSLENKFNFSMEFEKNKHFLNVFKSYKKI